MRTPAPVAHSATQGTADDRRRQAEAFAAETAAARTEAERRVGTLQTLVKSLEAEVLARPTLSLRCAASSSAEAEIGFHPHSRRLSAARQVASCKAAIARLQLRIEARGDEEFAAGDDDVLLLHTPGRGLPAAGSRAAVFPLLAPVTPMVVAEGARGEEGK